MTSKALTDLNIDEINARLADAAEELRNRWDEIVPDGLPSSAEQFAQVASVMAEAMPNVKALTTERSARRDAILGAPSIRALGHELGWSEQEIKHVEDAQGDGPLNYGEECVVLTHSGRAIHSPAYPAECSYIRIVEQGFELGYWDKAEWSAAPDEVMGAIMGSLKHDVEAPDADMLGGFIDTTRTADGQRPLL